MRVHVFGSHNKGDHIAFKVAKDLKSVLPHEFIFSNDPTELLHEDRIVILDAVEGINKVTVFLNVKDLKTSHICSLHDFDLGYFLRLADNLGLDQQVTIIGLPMKGNFQQIKHDTISSLQELQDFVFRP